MIKKWLTILSLIVLALSIVACTNNDDNTNNDDENLSEEQPGDQDEENPEDTDSDISDPGSNNNPNDNKDEPDEPSEETPEDQDPVDKKVIIKDPSIAVLVNKEYSLNESYAPDDLVTVEVPTILENPEVNQLRKVAADALKEMFEKAKESDIYLYARSGYRSYNTQVHLFQNYVNRHGEEAANRYSARPGQSEHQTGLVMDVTSESVNFQLTEGFGETLEGQWVKDHAHEFGFIIRYPKGAEDITGYVYEPWHIRYLGVDLATKVYESKLTYEEFLEGEGLTDEVIEVNSEKKKTE